MGSFGIALVGERRLHLLFEAPRVQSVHVVVAVVREQQPAVLDEAAQPLPLVAAEADELVPGHEQERKRHQLVRRRRDDDLLRKHRDGGVLDDGIEDVGRHLGVVVPVAGLVAEPGKDEFRGARTALGAVGERHLTILTASPRPCRDVAGIWRIPPIGSARGRSAARSRRAKAGGVRRSGAKARPRQH